jgi:uncharacterized protein (DUF433 family)
MLERDILQEKSVESDAPHSLGDIISVHPNRLSGEPCFAGTRVPIRNLFDYLEGGDSLDDFLEGFPGVTRQQAIAVLELAGQRLLEELNAV